MTSASQDPVLARLLSSLEVAPSSLLGCGGEANVYALDNERVLRVLHAGADHETTKQRTGLVDELSTEHVSFALPQVLDTGVFEQRYFTIDRRLPGVSVLDALPTLGRSDRSKLIEAHLDAAAAIGDLQLPARPYLGDLLADPATRTATWHDYLVERIACSLARVDGFESVDPHAIAHDMPHMDDVTQARLVHLDAFTGNMMSVGTSISAVIDFGHSSVYGDRRLDPLSAAVYLCAAQITPIANEVDRDVVASWLRNAGLAEWYEPAQRWLAGFWAWASDDATLHQWCRSVLLDHSS